MAQRLGSEHAMNAVYSVANPITFVAECSGRGGGNRKIHYLTKAP